MARILLVEDDAALRQTLRTVLEKAGYAVIEAVDGQQALELFDETLPQLVLTDIVMPNREGIETIIELRRRDAQVPIIAMSGGGGSSAALFLTIAGHVGAALTLEKPIRQAVLLAAVESCLAGGAS